MGNVIKFSESAVNNTIKKGNLVLGINDTNYGPSDVTGFYAAADVPNGGYVVYYKDNSNNLRIFGADGDISLTRLLKNEFGYSGDTYDEVIPQTFSDPDIMVVNENYPDIITDGLMAHLDAGFTPSISINQNTWYDLTGNGFDLSLINGPILKYYNNGLIRTDGVDDSIETNLSAGVGQKNSTFIIAFDDANMGSEKRLFWFATVFGIIWKRETDPEFTHYIRINNVTDFAVNLGEIPTGLKHLAITVDEDYLCKFYINGELRHTQSFSGSAVDYSYYRLILARNPNNSDVSKFDYYGVSIYNRVLSDEEILHNFNQFYERFKFKIYIDTTKVGVTENNQFKFPIIGDDFTVEWGDGTVSTGLTGTTIHTYPSPGQYEVKCYGDMERVFFNDDNIGERVADSLKILEVRNWGDTKWTSMERAFPGCSNLQVYTHSIPNLENCTNMYRTFYRSAGICLKNSESLSKWDVSNITSLYQTFFNIKEFTTDLSKWDVSNVTNMGNLFQESTYNQDISSWDVSSVTNMGRMFWLNRSFNQPIGVWNTSSLVSVSEMFEGNAVFNQDISNWTVTNITNYFEFMKNSNLDTEYYDNILISWEAQGPKPNISIHFGTSKYTANSAASVARQSLIDNYNWTITDGGSV